ncbi:hypothetical protein Dimus_018361 [Dionaea muscipula]
MEEPAACSALGFLERLKLVAAWSVAAQQPVGFLAAVEARAVAKSWAEQFLVVGFCDATVVEEVPAVAAHAQQKETMVAGVDPLGPSGHIPDSVMSKLQADFERARANRIQVDLEKAQEENARLLALLQQAQSQPKP